MIFGTKDKSLQDSYAASRVLVCGELHGVKENADILYTLVTLYGCDVLAIERTESEVGSFMKTVIEGKPDFSLVDSSTFFASMLSVEMAKAIHCLFKEGRIKKLSYIDTEDDEVEAGLAKNLLSLDGQEKTVAVMGNWHTMLEKLSDHTSALLIARESRLFTYVEYQYAKGEYYNAGSGLDSIENDSHASEYAIRTKDNDTFLLSVPLASPIAHL